MHILDQCRNHTKNIKWNEHTTPESTTSIKNCISTSCVIGRSRYCNPSHRYCKAPPSVSWRIEFIGILRFDIQKVSRQGLLRRLLVPFLTLDFFLFFYVLFCVFIHQEPTISDIIVFVVFPITTLRNSQKPSFHKYVIAWRSNDVHNIINHIFRRYYLLVLLQ